MFLYLFTIPLAMLQEVTLSFPPLCPNYIVSCRQWASGIVMKGLGNDRYGRCRVSHPLLVTDVCTDTEGDTSGYCVSEQLHKSSRRSGAGG